MLWIALLSLVVGLIALVWSADRFLNGAAIAARDLGVSKMLIGLTVVSLGTSAPEILVAVSASLADNCAADAVGSTNCANLAIGNAIGSNIANIGLVLGVTALIGPLPFGKSVLRSELPWLIGATLLGLVCLYDLTLSVLDAVLLLTALGLIIWRVVRAQQNKAVEQESFEELDELPQIGLARANMWLVTGLLVLLASAQLLVWAATTIAAGLHVDELIIGLTIVAVGTSLPELAATVGSAMKGHSDIAIGNVVGSNILNVLAVMAVPGLITTVDVSAAALWRDYGMMLAMTLMLVLFAYGINSYAVITRFEGGVLLATWIAYNLLLYYQANPYVY